MAFNRRTLLGGTLGGFFATAMRHSVDGTFATHPRGPAKRCVVLWMNGGPSQIDTFDPKPGTTTGGEFGAISTAVPGMQISETLPQVAQRMNHLSIIRNLTSREGEHLRGQYYLHTGFRFVPGFPRPALGSVVSHEAEPAEFPQYVTIGSRGYGPAYMGPNHAPFSIEDPDEALELMRSIRRRKRRLGLLQELGTPFDQRHADDLLNQRRSMIARIESLVSTEFVRAVDLSQESRRHRDRYGDTEIGRACLLARRLLEAGVNFVEVQHDGWDTHQNNFVQTRRLCGGIDQPWAALMDDLESSGLLDETIVLWLGEFGRTPNINPQRGRDHFPQVTPAVIGGGGLAGGRIVGQTNRNGTAIDGQEYSIADLFATVFSTLGIQPETEFTTNFGSPTTATEAGRPLTELL